MIGEIFFKLIRKLNSEVLSIVLLLLFGFVINTAEGQITMLSEGFEGGTIPSGWTKVNMNGLTNWTFNQAGGYLLHPAAAHSGNYNALLFKNDSVSRTVTRLISPVINLSGNISSARVRFWYCQAKKSTNQDTLKVYYRTTATGTWNLLKTYSGNVTSWTKDSITLPGLTSTYYLAFQGTAKFGYGVCLDDITVLAVPECGSVYSGTITPEGFWQNAAYNAGAKPYWKFAAQAGRVYEFSMCSSSQDSKLTLYNSAGVEVYYNEDDGPLCSGFSASVRWTCSFAGDYYISAAAFGCGNLQLAGNLAYRKAVDFICPANALSENEPDCYSGYSDNFNGGCQSAPPAFTNINRCFETICGKSGNISSVLSDTDYYKIVLADTVAINWKVMAKFPVKTSLIRGTGGCPAYTSLASANASSGDTASINLQVIPGTYWLKVFPASSINIPCGTPYLAFFNTVLKPPKPTAAANPACSSTYLNSISPSGNLTYYWQGQSCGTSMSFPAASVYSVTSTGTYYVRTYNTRTGCWSGECENVQVLFPPSPTVTATGNGVHNSPNICRGSSVTLSGNVSGGLCNQYQYRWSRNNTIIRDWSDVISTADSPVTDTTYILDTRCKSYNKALVIYSGNNDCNVSSYLGSDARFDAVGTWNGKDSTPTLSYLKQYDVVITWSDFPYHDAVSLGNLIKQYVDEGGGLVILFFAHNTVWGLQGDFLTSKYDPIEQSDYYSDGAVSIGTITNPSHPVMAGVSNVTATYHQYSTLLTPGAIPLFYWSDNYIGAAVKTAGYGSIAALNLYPCTAGGTNNNLLIANAASWVNSLPSCVVSDTLRVRVYTTVPATAGSISGLPNPCQGQNTVSYSVAPVTNTGSYLWSYSGSGATINGNSNNVSVNFSSSARSGNLTVRGVNGCGNGPVSPNFLITPDTVPQQAGNISGNSTVCRGQNNVSYSTGVVPGATSYTWSYTGTGATITGTGNTVSVNFNGTATSGNFTVRANNLCGSGAVSATFPVSIITVPDAPGSISGSTTVCQGTSGVSYTVTAVNGATSYNWSYSGSGVVITGNGNTVSINFDNNATSGYLSVSAVNNCGPGAASAGFLITVNQLPRSTGSILGDTVLCQGEQNLTYLTGIVNGAINYYWYFPDNRNYTTTLSSVTVNIRSNASSGYLTVKAHNNCGFGPISQVFLRIYPIYNRAANVSICNGDSIFLAHLYRHAAGVYTDTFPSTKGCDSIVNFHLSIIPADIVNRNVIICLGDSIFLQGAYRHIAAVYYDTLSSIHSCDSIVITHLSISLPVSGSVYRSICQGDSLFAGGLFRKTPGNYFDTLNSHFGCDSIVTTHLSINYPNTTILSPSLCVGEYYNYRNYTTPGFYTDTIETFINISGCDSIIVAHITVHPAYSFDIYPSICQGDIYHLPDGNTVSAGGNYTAYLLSIFGCDSTIVTHLNVFPSFIRNDNVAVCQGQSYFAQGQLRYSSGIYYDTLNAINTCDSIIVTHLTVNNTYDLNRNIEICQGDSLFAGGRYRKTAGNYTDTLHTHFGCDSIIKTHLTVNYPSTTNLNPSICTGDYYGHHLYTLPGLYTDTLDIYNNIFGCDSVVVAHITVHPVYSHDVYSSICQGDVYHLPDGNTVTASGNYPVTIGATAFGCDSIIITHLTVFPAFSRNNNISICQGDRYFAQGQLRYTNGNYYDTLNTIHGCDSIIVTILYVIPSDIITRNITLCQGDSIFLEGSFRYITGTFYDTLLSIHLCDSVIITNLSVNTSIYNTVNTSVCDGDSLFFGGSYLHTPGTYSDTLHAVFGCDSIITLNLSINPVFTTVETPIICAGSYYGHHFYGSAGSFTDTMNVFSSISGCDSIIIAHVTVHASYNIDQFPSICQGEIYLLPGGLHVTIGGIYSDTLHTVLSCDSIIITHLTVNPSYSGNNDVSICQGQSYFAQGQLQYTSGNYYDTLTTAHGCDSVIVTVLTVNQLPGPAGTITGSDTVCAGETGVVYHSTMISHADYYLWQFNGGGTQLNGNADSISADFSPNATNGTLTVTGVNACGNSNVSAPFSIHVNPLPLQGILTGPDTLCQGAGPEQYTLSNIGNVDSYTWNYSGHDVVLTNNGNSALFVAGDSALSGILSVTGTNACGTGPATEKQITVEVCQGIMDVNISNEFIVFPNPNNGSFYVYINKNHVEYLHIRILNLLGQTVYYNSLLRGENDKAFYIQLNDLPNGVYHIEISDKTGFSSKRVVINR